MKKITYILSILTIGMIGGFVITGPAHTDASNSTLEDGRTLGVHHISLSEGIEATDFERFIREEFEPVIKDMFPGIELLIMRGERNAEEGEYLLVYDIQSLWIRDYYFPTTSENSAATAAVVDKCGVRCSLIWDRFDDMTERIGWADYVELVD